MTQEKLNELVDKLREASTATLITRDEFKNLLTQAVTVLELTPNDLAKRCKTSPLTVKRWWAGISAPHSLGRPAIFKALFEIAFTKRLQTNIKEMDRQSLENIRAEWKK